jgi:hypothetical protein
MIGTNFPNSSDTRYILESKDLWKQDIWKVPPSKAVALSLDNDVKLQLDADKISKLAHKDVSLELENIDINIKSFAKDRIIFTNPNVIDALGEALPNTKMNYKWSSKDGMVQGRTHLLGSDVINSVDWIVDKNGIRHESETSREDTAYQPKEVKIQVDKYQVLFGSGSIAQLNLPGFGNFSLTKMSLSKDRFSESLNNKYNVNLGSPDTKYVLGLSSKKTSSAEILDAKDIAINYNEELRKAHIMIHEMLPDIMKSHENSGPDII